MDGGERLWASGSGRGVTCTAARRNSGLYVEKAGSIKNPPSGGQACKIALDTWPPLPRRSTQVSDPGGSSDLASATRSRRYPTVAGQCWTGPDGTSPAFPILRSCIRAASAPESVFEVIDPMIMACCVAVKYSVTGLLCTRWPLHRYVQLAAHSASAPGCPNLQAGYNAREM